MATIVLLYMGLPTSGICGTPYAAHPERELEATFQRESNFLITEAFRHLAEAHDAALTADEARRIEDRILGSGFISYTFGLGPQYFTGDETARFKLKALIGSWQPFPKADWINPWSSTDPDTADAAAHQAIRLVYEITGIPRFTTATDVLYATANGAAPYYLDQSLSKFEKLAREYCDGKLSEEITAAAELSNRCIVKPLTALRSALPSSLARYLDGAILGKGKTCSTLVDDLFRIVEPHHIPIDTIYNHNGRIEGTAIYVARQFLPVGLKPGSSRLFQLFTDLERAKALDPALSTIEALKKALGQRYTSRELITALSAVSHNHGVELYLHKTVLELQDDQAQATALSKQTSAALNTAYALLNAHHSARRAAGATDIEARPDRPYHFWGGALVACELSARGYRPQVAEKVSAMSGAYYEFLTDKSHKNSINDGIKPSFDSELQLEGARFGATACKK